MNSTKVSKTVNVETNSNKVLESLGTALPKILKYLSSNANSYFCLLKVALDRIRSKRSETQDVNLVTFSLGNADSVKRLY